LEAAGIAEDDLAREFFSVLGFRESREGLGAEVAAREGIRFVRGSHTYASIGPPMGGFRAFSLFSSHLSASAKVSSGLS